MYQRKQTLFCTLFIVIVLSSCTILYVPTTARPGMYKQKGDFSVGVSTAGKLAEFHGGYAVTNHVAVAGCLSRGSESNTSSQNSDTSSMIYKSTTKTLNRRRDNELSVGYFTPLGTQGTFEVFAGGATYLDRAKIDHQDFENPSNSFVRNQEEVKYNRFFIQPAVGIRGKYADLYYVNRFTMVQYFNPGLKDVISENYLVMRVGSPTVKLMFQLGFVLPVSDLSYAYEPVTLGIGLVYAFDAARFRGEE